MRRSLAWCEAAGGGLGAGGGGVASAPPPRAPQWPRARPRAEQPRERPLAAGALAAGALAAGALAAGALESSRAAGAAAALSRVGRRTARGAQVDRGGALSSTHPSAPRGRQPAQQQHASIVASRRIELRGRWHRTGRWRRTRQSALCAARRAGGGAQAPPELTGQAEAPHPPPRPAGGRSFGAAHPTAHGRRRMPRDRGDAGGAAGHGAG